MDLAAAIADALGPAMSRDEKIAKIRELLAPRPNVLGVIVERTETNGTVGYVRVREDFPVGVVIAADPMFLPPYGRWEYAGVRDNQKQWRRVE